MGFIPEHLMMMMMIMMMMMMMMMMSTIKKSTHRTLYPLLYIGLGLSRGLGPGECLYSFIHFILMMIRMMTKDMWGLSGGCRQSTA